LQLLGRLKTPKLVPFVGIIIASNYDYQLLHMQLSWEEKTMKKLIAILLSIALIVSFGACGGSEAETNGLSADQPIVFVVSHVDPDDSIMGSNFLAFEKYVEEHTDGKVDVQVYSNGSLGGEREIVEAILMGTIHLSLPATSVLSTYDERFNIFEVPFLFSNYDAYIEAWDGELGDTVKEWAEDYGFKIYGWASFGFRGLSNSVRAVSTPQDLAGMKIRVIESDLYIDTFRLLGANPTPMSYNEVYTGLQQKTIDGQDNPPELTYMSKFSEVQDYYTDLNHVLCNGAYITNKNYMDGLPDDVLSVIEEAITIIMQDHRERSVIEEEKSYDAMESQGLTVTRLTDEQRSAFRDLVAPVQDKYRKLVGDDVFDLALSYSN
jgi:C4-dicarboxylate-binding protein DctP